MLRDALASGGRISQATIERVQARLQDPRFSTAEQRQMLTTIVELAGQQREMRERMERKEKTVADNLSRTVVRNVVNSILSNNLIPLATVDVNRSIAIGAPVDVERPLKDSYRASLVNGLLKDVFVDQDVLEWLTV